MREMKTLGLAAVAALAVGLYAASIAGASSNGIEKRVLRTVSCPTALGALQLSAFASNPTIGSANVSITTGNQNTGTGLLGLSNKQTRFGLNGTCHSVAKRVAMTHRGLSSFLGVSHAGDIGWTSVLSYRLYACTAARSNAARSSSEMTRDRPVCLVARDEHGLRLGGDLAVAGDDRLVRDDALRPEPLERAARHDTSSSSVSSRR